MKKETGIKILWLFLLCIFLLAGCSKDGGGTTEIERNTESDGTIENELNDKSVQDGNSGEQSLWVKATETIPFEEPGNGYQVNIISYAALGNKVYLLRTEYPEAGGTVVCTNI